MDPDPDPVSAPGTGTTIQGQGPSVGGRGTYRIMPYLQQGIGPSRAAVQKRIRLILRKSHNIQPYLENHSSFSIFFESVFNNFDAGD